MTRTLLCCVWLALWALPARAAGTISLSQDEFTVQDKADFSWLYTVGEDGLAAGDLLRLHDPVFQGMRWSKWGDLTPWWNQCSPQSTGQEASWGLVSTHVRRDGERLSDVEVEVSRSNCDGASMSCSADIHEAAWTEVTVLSGTLQPGDEVVIGIGDVGACEARCTEGDCAVCTDCGFEMADRAFADVAWPAELCLVDADCEPLESAHLAIASLSVPDLLLATTPSQGAAGEPFRLKVALLDRWGNPVTQATHTLEILAPGGSQTHTLTEEDGGWHDFEVVLDAAGIHRIEVNAGPMRTWTNPIEILDEAPDDQIFWGDIHVHHGYTFIDEDGASHDLNHDYGRDVVGLDIVSQTQNAKGIELEEDALWTELQASCRGYSEPGEYLVLLGFEWMGDLASETYGIKNDGHHNVYYNTCEAPIGTHDLDTIDALDGELGLWSWLAQTEASTGVRGITVPHAMRWTGRNFTGRNPGTQTLVEVYSEWGDNTLWSEGQLDSDEPGTTQDLMNSGLRLGWIGGSDNHDGWMGNPSSQKNERSGLGAFIAPSLRRAAIFNAMALRRTYATTGHRPILRFRAEDGPYKLGQGSELIARDPVLRWRYSGTGEVERTRLFRMFLKAGAPQELVMEQVGEGMDLAGELALGPIVSGTVAYWLEVRQWDGEIAWSSPIWLTRECERLSFGAVDPLGICDERVVAEGLEKETRTRCSCAQGPAQGAAWLLLAAVGLIRRSERCSPRRGQG